ncbi:MAG TPA: hypothetical protein VJH20_02840 [Candidatus Nanoarchaeia archaeon]|nr:hypothetical protein [Candidatus Nanoarchaeia archaeon]
MNATIRCETRATCKAMAVEVPTIGEIRQWIIGTVRHVQHIEYYLERLQLGKEDPQRPHDIIGYGNKLEWEVIRGLAVQYRDRSPEFFYSHVEPSLERHRCQYHHLQWNAPNYLHTDGDMKVGAVDAICSLLEPDREYQGGKHTSMEIDAIIEKNPEYKQIWMREIHAEMQRIASPNLYLITDLDDMPNIGINPSTYDILGARLHDTLEMLQNRGYMFGGNRK